MATLVFDIETSALSLDSFDDSSQEYLMRPAANLSTEEEQEAALQSTRAARRRAFLEESREVERAVI